jgi:hypothetical protein
VGDSDDVHGFHSAVVRAGNHQLCNRQNINEVTSVYGGGTPDFCGAIPTHYNDAASLAIQEGRVKCGPDGGLAVAPTPNPLFGTPRTMFTPRQLQASVKFTF